MRLSRPKFFFARKRAKQLNFFSRASARKNHIISYTPITCTYTSTERAFSHRALSTHTYAAAYDTGGRVGGTRPKAPCACTCYCMRAPLARVFSLRQRRGGRLHARPHGAVACRAASASLRRTCARRAVTSLPPPCGCPLTGATAMACAGASRDRF